MRRRTANEIMTRGISVVVPCLDEEDSISATLDAVLGAASDCDVVVEVIVVDDGSTDATPTIVLEKAKSTPSLRLVKHEFCRGNAEAVSSGVAVSHMPDILLVPGDYTYGLEPCRLMLAGMHHAPFAPPHESEPTPRIWIGRRSRSAISSRGWSREVMAQLARLVVWMVSPSTTIPPNVGLLGFSRELSFPVPPDFPPMFYHLAILVVARRLRVQHEFVGIVDQIPRSGEKSTRIGWRRAIGQAILFVKVMKPRARSHS